MKINWKSTLGPLASLAAPILGSVIAGKGTKYQGIAQVAVKSAVTKIDGGIDKLVASFEKYEGSNEIVGEAVSEFKVLAGQAGFMIPSLEFITSHIKAAIFDVATGLAPNAGISWTDPGEPGAPAPVTAPTAPAANS